MQRLALLTLAAIVFSGSSPDARAEDAAEAQFMEAYLHAHNTGNLARLFSMLEPGVDLELKKKLGVVLAHSFRLPITSIELVPENAKQQEAAARDKGRDEAEKNGSNYNLVVRFPEKSETYTRLSFPVRRQNGKLYIAANGR